MAQKAFNNLISKGNPSGSKGGSLLKRHLPFLVLLSFYVLFNLWTLTKYPRVHDDEGILSNFGYQLAKGGLPIVDPSQSNHGYLAGITVVPLSGILFYGSLAVLGHLWGFGLFVMRLQPLFFSVVSVALTYAIGLRCFGDRNKALLAAFFLAASTKFFVAAHMVRQESMWVAAFLGIFLLFLTGFAKRKKHYLFIAAALSGAAVCVHPNGIFMPLLLGVLVLARRRDWRGDVVSLLLPMSLFTLLGGLLFIFCDYLPARQYYWGFFHSPLLHGFTHRYEDVFSPWRVVTDFSKSLWNDFWEASYRRNLFYLFLDAAALIGGFAFRKKENSLFLLTILLLAVMLLPLHINAFYYVYFVPFFSLLLASVMKDAWDRRLPLARPASILALFLALLYPLATAWMFRGYDFGRVSSEVASRAESGNVLGSHAFFFAMPPERLFSRYILIDYELRKLMSEVPLRYFILDRFTAPYVDAHDSAEPFASVNAKFLAEECRESLSLNDYQPRSRNPKDDSNRIVLFDCNKPDTALQ
jgi:hypothetical protein